MKILDAADSSATILFDRREVLTINNALNEVCNGIHLEGEFETRMGTTVEDARRLLRAIGSLL